MHTIEELIELALKEDIGPGDITTDALVDETCRGEGEIIAKDNFVLAGLNVAGKVFRQLDHQMLFSSSFTDGDRVNNGNIIVTVSGKLRSLLKGERTALNFLQRLSGIATLTRTYTEKIKDRKTRIVDTRKTTPGWRALEKYAVRTGGGFNHRMGLYDGVLIKDNHIAVAGGICQAVSKARQAVHHLVKIEVEVSTLHEVTEALESGADVIMLDNMDIKTIRSSIKMINGRAPVEVSGGVQLKDILMLADAGVDIISVGALTHSASGVDISMRIRGPI
jgi:nicotinate-nucleotide pyrophosphorylase (carboxylating)